MEWVFIVPALMLLSFLPFPPHGREIASFVTLSTGIVGAGLVWWGLRVPTRLAWWGALVLSGAWLLSSTGILILFSRMVVAIVTGHAKGPDMNPAIVISALAASVPTTAQAIILVAWLRGSSRA